MPHAHQNHQAFETEQLIVHLLQLRETIMHPRECCPPLLHGASKPLSSNSFSRPVKSFEEGSYLEHNSNQQHTPLLFDEKETKAKIEDKKVIERRIIRSLEIIVTL
ncbi:hypothetical protein NC652_015562 [Populus alba x Populus x berolinensis]|nr:hypothetical protein NC652_015562 [Populus alba x Populus x berolinensis]